MEQRSREVRRRRFLWSGTVREMVTAYRRREQSKTSRGSAHAELKEFITQIAAVSGNPRSACWKFVRQTGLTSGRPYRPWTKPEQQKLLDLSAAHSLQEVAVLLRRRPASVRSMLHRLGASARMGQDWFTKHALAEALHVRAEEVQRWIERGWLKCRMAGTNGLRRAQIDAEDFCEFCKEHRQEIVGNRLNVERLNFVQTFVFPPSHADLLPVRSAKKEQAAYEQQTREEQTRKEADGHDDIDELDATA